MKLLYIIAFFVVPFVYLLSVQKYPYAIIPLFFLILIVLIEKVPGFREFVKKIF